MLTFAIGNSSTKQLNKKNMYEFRFRVFFNKQKDARRFSEVLKSSHWTDNCSLYLDDDYVSFSIKKIVTLDNAFSACEDVKCSLNEICPKCKSYDVYELSFSKLLC